MIRLSDVVKGIRERDTTPLRGRLRMEVNGEFVFLVGPPEAANRPSSSSSRARSCRAAGLIEINGFNPTNISDRQIPLLRRSIGVIFQDFRLIEKKNGL